MPIWNPWHGCKKFSAGCENCYVYRGDQRYNRADSFIVKKNSDFDLPLRKNRSGGYKLSSTESEFSDPVFTCMTSDFFVEDADLWRDEIWRMIKIRSDLHFFIITKRIHRAAQCFPADWHDGYDNVTICCTIENQQCADYRLPIFAALPVKRKYISCEPLLEDIDFHGKLSEIDTLRCVVAGGESGDNARPCDYQWILSLRQQTLSAGKSFWFKQTGARFVKDGKLYNIPRRFQHEQARKATKKWENS